VCGAHHFGTIAYTRSATLCISSIAATGSTTCSITWLAITAPKCLSGYGRLWTSQWHGVRTPSTHGASELMSQLTSPHDVGPRTVDRIELARVPHPTFNIGFFLLLENARASFATIDGRTITSATYAAKLYARTTLITDITWPQERRSLLSAQSSPAAAAILAALCSHSSPVRPT